MSHRSAQRRLFVALAASAALLITGCGGSSGPEDGAAAAADASTAEPLTVSDAWVKVADSGMTAVFGMIHNTTDADVTIASATTTASDMAELHEVVEQDGQMVMQPKEGGFVVPAGGMLELKPGAEHIMVMNLTDPVEAGEEIGVDLTLGDGSSLRFTALAKDTTAGEETYDDTGHTHGTDDTMDDMDMGDDS